MRRPQDPSSLSGVSTVLEDLSAALARVEDDLLSSLVVMGESDPQRAVDGWVDQVVDLLRAVDEVATQHRTTLALARARAGGRSERDRQDRAGDTIPASTGTSREDTP